LRSLFGIQLPATLGQKTSAASLAVVVASDQSAVPVSGTVTATGPLTDTQLRASPVPVSATALTDGTQKAIVRGGAKGATAAADLTGTAQGADHQALDVQIMHGGAAKDPTQIRALTNADVVKVQLQDNAGTAITLGQKVAASSVPVVLASDQGNSTSALQTTGNTSLSNIDTNAGAQGDAAVVSDVNGTLSGKLRGLVKMLASVWDSANGWLKIAIRSPLQAVTASGSMTLANDFVELDPQGRRFAAINVKGCQGFTGRVGMRVTVATGGFENRFMFSGDALTPLDVLPPLNPELSDERTYSCYLDPGVTKFRVYIYDKTAGGTLTVILTASDTPDPALFQPALGIDGGNEGPTIASESPISYSVGGSDKSSGVNTHRTVQVKKTIGLLTDEAFIVRPVEYDRTVGPTVLQNLNDAVTIDLDGFASAGFVITASTFTGTLVAEVQGEPAGAWMNTSILNEASVAWLVSGLVAPVANTGYSLIFGTGARKLRIRVSLGGTGSCAVTVVATKTISPFSAAPYLSLPGITSPFFTAAVNGVDGSGVARALLLKNSDPASTDYGQVTRDNRTVSLDAKMGTVADQAGAYTLMDRVDAVRKVVATEATLKLVLAALQPKPAPKSYTTLLHR
jgi:hypothetical protein